MILILIKAVFKARRNGLLRLTAADKPVRLDCLADKCALCCKTLGSPVVTEQEAENLDCTSIVKTKHGMFIKSKGSVCSLLKEGLCSCYPNRPKGCREYPWYNIDGQLYYDIGCPGIKYDKDQRPAVNDIQPFENFFLPTPGPVIRLIRKICQTDK